MVVPLRAMCRMWYVPRSSEDQGAMAGQRRGPPGHGTLGRSLPSMPAVTRRRTIRADPEENGGRATVETSSDEPKAKEHRAACYQDPALVSSTQARPGRDGVVCAGQVCRGPLGVCSPSLLCVIHRSPGCGCGCGGRETGTVLGPSFWSESHGSREPTICVDGARAGTHPRALVRGPKAKDPSAACSKSFGTIADGACPLTPTATLAE